MRSQWHFCEARESICFPKYTRASWIIQETICSCITNPCLAQISQFSFGCGGSNCSAETGRALPLQTGARQGTETQLPLVLLTPTTIPDNPGKVWTALSANICLTLFPPAFFLLQYGNLLHMPAALNSRQPSFVPRVPACAQSWHLPFHKEIVQMWRFLILIFLFFLATSEPRSICLPDVHQLSGRTTARCDKQGSDTLHPLPWLALDSKN